VINIGAHVSIAGSLDLAIDRAAAIGASCVQIFGSAPQQWQSVVYPLEQIGEFNRKREEAGIAPVFLHSIYLINLASENHFILGNSIASLVQYLKLGKLIGAEGVIFHTGSHRGRGFESVAGQVAEALSQILSQTEGMGKLIIENSAGAGGIIGSKFAEIGFLVKAVNSPRLAVCLDTAHAFESGYNLSGAIIARSGEAGPSDLRTKSGLTRTLEEFDKEIGLEKLVVIHANDSKTPLGSNRDRHENIGEGEIGLAGFREIVNHPALKDLPFVIETPGFPAKGGSASGGGQHGPDRKNIETLRALAA
jgi:deoxyribonuclease-4